MKLEFFSFFFLPFPQQDHCHSSRFPIILTTFFEDQNKTAFWKPEKLLERNVLILIVVNTFAHLKPPNFGQAMIFISVKINILFILCECPDGYFNNIPIIVTVQKASTCFHKLKKSKQFFAYIFSWLKSNWTMNISVGWITDKNLISLIYKSGS